MPLRISLDPAGQQFRLLPLASPFLLLLIRRISGCLIAPLMKPCLWIQSRRNLRRARRSLQMAPFSQRLITSFSAHPDPAEQDITWGPGDSLWSVAWSKSRTYLATGGWEDRPTGGWDFTTQGWKFRNEPTEDGEFMIKLWSFQLS